MHDHRTATEGRVQRFVRDHLEPAVYRDSVPLQISSWTASGEPVPAREAIRQTFTPFVIGEAWGAPWSTTWFHLTGTVPESWDEFSDVRLEAVIDLGFDRGQPGFQAEGLAYDRTAEPIKGISPLNSYLPLSTAPGEDVDFFVEAAGNPDIAKGFEFRPTPLGDLATAGSDPLYRFARADIALLDCDVWELLQDINVVDGLMQQLPLDLPRRAQLRQALDAMIDAVDPDDVSGTAGRGRAALREVLDSPAVASAHRIYAVGHAHIDSAWLWPVRETVRKCARTFSNVLDLINREPDFVFACSSAQQLAWMKEYYPGLFGRIKQAVADGRFVPVGGMWVEADANMPGGEAMARQLIAGKRFFLEEFGIECREVWLPDSFGYSAALPGIFAAAGATSFLTQKISWSATNRMPHHTFWWEGIDGTRTFTHFPPVDKYNSDLSAADLAHAERNFAEHGRATMSLVAFGWGDGGGGPTREMTAVAARTSSLEGSPAVHLADPRAFFADALAEYPDAPVWSGELYLELHRGAYTSQARTKRGNRRSEHLLREAELWAATAAVRRGVEYPYDVLERIWQVVLLQQFHDILPGSSIAWVHREAERNYEAIGAELEALIEERLRDLAGTGERQISFNAAPQQRRGVAALGAGSPITEQAFPVKVEPTCDGVVVDNGIVRVRIDQCGLITSLRDVIAGRELIPPGHTANLLQLHRDAPNEWDAWDIDVHYRRTVVDLVDVESMDVEGDDDVAIVRVARKFGQSSLVQELSVRRGSPAVDIVTSVDWHEQQKLLKLAFPFDIQADRSAAEVQFGHVFRATHSNTSWEAAKFEVCAHRWLHVGEPDYGVAVANDSTYGHEVTRGVAGGRPTTTVRLSLLRAPLYPDPDADQGLHTMRVQLVPGAGIPEAVRAGYSVNLPERAVLGCDDVAPLVTVSHPAAVIEAVKLAEDRSGDVVVRLYEAHGGRARVSLNADFDFSAVNGTDLLEREVDSSAIRGCDGRTVELQLRPFQIVTLRFVRGPGRASTSESFA